MLATSPLLKRILREHVWRYRKRIALAIACMLIVAASTATNAWLMQPALDKIFIARDRTMLLIIPLAVVCTALIGAGANYAQVLTMRTVGLRIVADMQQRLIRHLLSSDLSLFHTQASGRLISRFTNDIQLLRNAFSTAITTVIKESVSLVFLVIVMVAQNWKLAAIAFVVFPVAIYPVIRLGKRMRKLSDQTQHELGEFSAKLDDTFHSIRSVKSYNREEYEVGRTTYFIESICALYTKSARTQAASQPLMEVLSGICIAAVIGFGGLQVLDGTVTAGQFFSFIAAFMMAYKPVRAMAGLNTTLQEGLSAAARLFTVLDTAPSIRDREGALPLRLQGGHIRFERVSFSYGPEAAGVHDVSLDVPAGKTVALVGHSGGGKSTLMNLLLRFYDATGGVISIDGQDIKGATLHSLRDAMAFVPQEAMLFDDTVRANIAYGREDAREEDIIEAATRAAAHEFILQLPKGYDTMIGAGGVRLSGGQRQRLAVARAMLKSAPILLLDEATSALDNESERLIQNALNQLMVGRTTLVIAHRLSTIVNADVIYVVEHGRIVESGTHATLLEQRGRYHALYAEMAQSGQAA